MTPVDSDASSSRSFSSPVSQIAAAPAATDVVHRARPHHRHRRRARWTAALLGVAIVVVAAACGSSKATTATSGTTSTTAKGGSSSASFTAYAACLKKNGVTLPAGFGQGRPGGTGGGTGGAPTGTFPARGTGGAGASFRNNPAFQKASQACASLRPKGGFGGRGGAGSTAYQAFVSCMSSHGITLRGRGQGGAGSSSTTVPATTMDTSTPQYQAAYATCKALLPTPGAGAPGSTTATTAAA